MASNVVAVCMPHLLNPLIITANNNNLNIEKRENDASEHFQYVKNYIERILSKLFIILKFRDF